MFVHFMAKVQTNWSVSKPVCLKFEFSLIVCSRCIWQSNRLNTMCSNKFLISTHPTNFRFLFYQFRCTLLHYKHSTKSQDSHRKTIAKSRPFHFRSFLIKINRNRSKNIKILIFLIFPKNRDFAGFAMRK